MLKHGVFARGLAHANARHRIGEVSTLEGLLTGHDTGDTQKGTQTIALTQMLTLQETSPKTDLHHPVKPL